MKCTHEKNGIRALQKKIFGRSFENENEHCWNFKKKKKQEPIQNVNSDYTCSRFNWFASGLYYGSSVAETKSNNPSPTLYDAWCVPFQFGY